MSAVETRDVFRIYGDGNAVALQGLTMSVQPGEVVVVFGPSGSGKSTLLRILARLDMPSAGTVTVFGDDLRELRRASLRDYRSRVLGYLDQHYSRALAPELTARELVALQPALLGVERARAARARGRAARARRPRRPSATRTRTSSPAASSSASRSPPRSRTARSCSSPTSRPASSTPRTRAIAYALIGELAREERLTAIVVSHDPQSASIADRVLHIRDGRVSAESASERGHAEEIVLARGGWLRLPEELLRVSGIAGRASARVEDGGIVVSPAAERAAAPEPAAPRAEASPGEVVAELRGVTKSYGRRRVLDGVDATFRGGCLTAVTGRSGSGKTTLLHLLAGLDAPDDGDGRRPRPRAGRAACGAATSRSSRRTRT